MDSKRPGTTTADRTAPTIFGVLGTPSRHTPADARQFRRLYLAYTRADLPHLLLIGPPHQRSYGWFAAHDAGARAASRVFLLDDPLRVATEADFLFVPGPLAAGPSSPDLWPADLREAVELFSCLRGTFGLIGVPGRPLAPEQA